jgi:hypothetical protein
MHQGCVETVREAFLSDTAPFEEFSDDVLREERKLICVIGPDQAGERPMKYLAILLIVLLGNQSVALAQSGGPSGRGSTTGDPAASSANPRSAPRRHDRRVIKPERQRKLDLGRPR